MQAGTISMGLFMVCFHVSPSAFITPKENITCVYAMEARIAIVRSLLLTTSTQSEIIFGKNFQL